MKINKDDVHNILAEYYDDCYDKNPFNAKKNVSKIIKDLKKKIDELN